MGQLLRRPGAESTQTLRDRAKTRVKALKGSVLHDLAHLLPSRPTDPLLEAIYIAFARRQLTGCYAEFGVFTGRSSIRAYHYLKAARAGTPTPMFAFDSFEGLPELSAADRVRYEDFQAGEYSCSEEDYLATVTRMGIPRELVHTVPGWFSDTCNATTAAQIGLGPIAVAHIDCDILSSTLDVLRFLGDQIEDGGIIVFDDYGSYRAHPQLGQRGALARWQEERPDLWITPVSVPGAGSASFSVHHKLTERDIQSA